ncbi:MAG TPA: VWA domain-containing protein [Arenimonas sp.]|nr:VWA domain-containing protein [Arenimonas sp.]
MAMPLLQQSVSPQETYAGLPDNPLQSVLESPVSTFSIDVDTGSYSNIRRMLLAGQRPPREAVRAEEMINYFHYGHPAPTDARTPFKVSAELAPAPWNADRQLLMLGIQGYTKPMAELPPANLVFLIDTSGSMFSEDKLPLLKTSLRQLLPQLRAKDRISIVAYAGSAGLVLPPTPGDQRGVIEDALERLQAGGSTNGGEGIQLAYATARQHFIDGGINRIVLATDGDFNVGIHDRDALKTLVADQRRSGVSLSTLGFGTGNYHDAMAEQLANVGNGSHAYIDSVSEGRKVLVEELSATLMTIAKDVKIQLEFNPAVVAEYRLIGYENRMLRREDFNNDQVDAGEIGAGHNVTALYELTLVDAASPQIDPLRYQPNVAAVGKGEEIGLLRLRYKQPDGEQSRLIETPLQRREIASHGSERLRFAAAVAAYADLLRGGERTHGFGWPQVASLAAGSTLPDPHGYRREFLDLVERARLLTGGDAAVAISE